MIKSISLYKDFNRNIKMLAKSFCKDNKIKVKITESQIGILEYCAFLGIEDLHQLTEIVGIKKPTFKE